MKKIILSIMLIVGMLAIEVDSYADFGDIVYQSGNWVVTKATDEMTDEVTYYLIEKFNISMQYFSTGQLILFVHYDCVGDIKNHNTHMRIDKNEPINVFGNGAYPIHNNAIDQMKKGNTLKTKRFCWVEADQIVTVSLIGFTKAYNEFARLAKIPEYF